MRTLNWGIPTRMARAMYALFARDGQEAHQGKVDLIDRLLCDDERIPLATDTGAPTGEPAIWHAAEVSVRQCWAFCHDLGTADAILAAVAGVCARRGIAAPRGDTDEEKLARALDKAWWRRHLRTEFKRRFEHTAIQLGLTYVKTDPYVSRETALMQERQNRANAELLENRIATNEHGQSYSVADLADKGTANKANRRNELMTRIRGFEEVADTLRHVGLFWTITCPSRFHSVGGTNAKYDGSNPRDAQAYLVAVWALIRAALHRQGIRPYGFRIAEPHSDGCPHWHLLLFVERDRSADAEETVKHYALLDEGQEAGAQKNRVKLVRIEAGKGTAAGYIAKYVSKNIDGTGVGDHKTFESGQTYIVAPDTFGQVEITPSARVTYWSQAWGIRQFQQIGGAPIGVWRELRRIKAETLQNAPEAVREAHAAVQKIESTDPAVAKQADFAAYLWAQGGPTVPRRRLAVRVAAREVEINGRYSQKVCKKPVGVYAAAFPNEVYEGVHYRWTVEGKNESGNVRFTLPRTGVNNCTPWPERPTGAPAWTRPDNAPDLHKKARATRGKVDRVENAGYGNPDSQTWSRADDARAAILFRKHSPRHAESHLNTLKRKYNDE
ncbi:replication endonuclease [Massilia sp. DD77]|uniref:replication endonuclease n=1 Tax=Massilia sp. DD77 TaxID=3109349 RepID=UPI003000A3EA